LFEVDGEDAELDRDGDGLLEYTSRLLSTRGRHDGLYWEAAPGEPPSPAGPRASTRVAARAITGQRQPDWRLRDDRLAGQLPELGRQNQEACGSAHHWARKLIELGHEVRLMAPQFVKPYVKTDKNDRNDAEAICEAVARPNMRFVPVKTPEQQAALALHRARAGVMKARNAQANQLRGLLGEFGIVLPQGIGQLRRRLPEIVEDSKNGLPGLMRTLLRRLLAQLQQLDQQVSELEREIVLWHRQNDDSCRLERIGGIGPLTASPYVASLGNAKGFNNGRQVAAWLGIVPRQDSTGGKPKLLGISKHGDVYLRTLGAPTPRTPTRSDR
jgi:transposase